jgi:hypothetical protein
VTERSIAAPLLEDAVRQAISSLDFERVRGEFWEQEECVFLDRFLPPDVVERDLIPEVERLRQSVHRNYIPGHKKGGSISSYTLGKKAPVFLSLYASPTFLDFLSRLVGTPILVCPEDDPHACALYYYTEPGDHIGFHYDTSYYKGSRYTVLLGLVQQSESCRLVAHLYKDDPRRKVNRPGIRAGRADHFQREQTLACRHAPCSRGRSGGAHHGVRHQPGDGAPEAGVLKPQGCICLLRRVGAHRSARVAESTLIRVPAP